jgi:DNA-binding response OmpR family regulator
MRLPRGNAMSAILAVGQDEELLATRAAVLRYAEKNVTIALPRDAAKILGDKQFDLVVLCHTLSPKEMIEVVTVAHRVHPGIRVLQMTPLTSSDLLYELVPADEKAPTEPRALVEKIVEMLDS